MANEFVIKNGVLVRAGTLTIGDTSTTGYAFPSTDGTNGQVLQTDGNGSLSFVDVSGVAGLNNVVEDTTPQLGGNLDVNSFEITSTSNSDIFITPDGAGNVVLDGLVWPSTDGTSGQALTTDGSGNLTFTTVSGGGPTDQYL